MDAKEKLAAGDVSGALEELNNAVRSDPARSDLRVFLFQMHCILGNWDRALTQLEVLRELDISSLPMCQTYDSLITCEVIRKKVFNGGTDPTILGEPEPWMALLIQALSAARDEAAQDLRERAFEQAPEVSGSIDDNPFSWIADADSRLGPVLEAMIRGIYYWVPMGRVSRIAIDPPEDLRDLVWAPAQFTWSNGGEEVGFIPVRYAGSENHDDVQIQLSRLTQWEERYEGGYYGLGQRQVVTDIGEYPLLSIGEILVNSAASD